MFSPIKFVINSNAKKCCRGYLFNSIIINFKFCRFDKFSVRSSKYHVLDRALYGLTPTDVRRLAYDVAVATGTNHPFNQTNKLVGKDRLESFLGRHSDLSVRQPQGTNLLRAVDFNRPKVNEFFGICKNVLNGHEYLPSKVWNMDETGITSVHQPGKVVASKEVRRVAKMPSGERGATVTVIWAVSAAGAYLPPFMIFPLNRMVDQLMQGPRHSQSATPVQAVGQMPDSF